MSASTILTSKRGFVRSSAFLAASLAFAAALPMSAQGVTATAVWESGQFEDAASSHGGYAITLPAGATIENGNIVLAGTEATGALIDVAAVSNDATSVSVLIKYSGVSAPSQACSFVSTYVAHTDGSYDMHAISIGDTLSLKGQYNNNTHDSNYAFSSPAPVLTASGYFLFTYNSGSGTGGYAGSILNDLSGGKNTGLKAGSRTISKVGIGGPTGMASSTYPTWDSGVTIEAVAIFVGQELSASDVKEYYFPVAGPTADFDYVTTISEDTTFGDITTWTKGTGTPGTNSTVYITSENNAVLTISGSLSLGRLKMVGGSITLADGASVSMAQIDGAISCPSGTNSINGATITGAITASANSTINFTDCAINGGVSAPQNGNVVVNTYGTVAFGSSANNDFQYSTTLNVESGTTTYNSASDRKLWCNINVRSGATLVNARNDGFNYDAQPGWPIHVHVRGTLTMNGKWTIGSGNYIHLYNGAVVDGSGHLHFNTGTGKVVVEEDGEYTVEAPFNTDNGTAKVEVKGSATLTLSNMPNNLKIEKAGTGTLKWADKVLRALSGTGGTIEIDAASVNLGHTFTSSTFDGVLKLTGSAKQNNLVGSGSTKCFSDDVRPELIADAMETYLSKDAYNGQTLYVRNLSGRSGAKLDARYTGGPISYTLDTLQEKDTEYAGIFNNNAGDTRTFALNVTGNNIDGIHALTLSGANASTNTLTVKDYAKVCFSSTGKWANGIVVVGNNGVLESQNSAAIAATLKVEEGATLTFANGVQLNATAYDWSSVTTDGSVNVDLSSVVPSAPTETLIPSGVTVTKDKFVVTASQRTATLSVEDGALQATFANFWRDGSWDGEVVPGEDANLYISQDSTLDVSEALSLGAVTVVKEGDGDVVLTISGDGALSTGGWTIPAGVTVNTPATMSISGTVSGDGVINVPANTTLAMVDVTCSAKVTVAGTLETSGTNTLSAANTSAAGSLIRVLSDETSLSTLLKGITGNIRIDGDATLKMVDSLNGSGAKQYYDNIDPDGTTTLDIYGTLSIQNNNFEFGDGITINLYDGAGITAWATENSTTYGDLTWLENGKITVVGQVTLNTTIRTVTGVAAEFDVVGSDSLLTVTKSFVSQTGSQSGGGSLTKTGAGTLKFTQEELTKPITISAGKVQLKKAFTSGLAISIAEGAELELGVGQGDSNVTGISFANVIGIGTIRYSSECTGYYTLPNSAETMFASTLSVVNDNIAGGLIVTFNNNASAVTTNRNMHGSGLYRSDWGSGTSRSLLALQDKNTEWSGTFYTAKDHRIKEFIVAGVADASQKTLTLSGTQVAAGSTPLTVESNGSANLTGTWIGNATVSGEFGGTGMLNGNLTFSSGATFKAYGTSGLTLSSGRSVVLPASGSVAVDVSVISNDITSAGVTLISSGVPGDITALSVDDAFYLASELGALKVYPVPDSPVAEYGGTSYYTFAEAIAAAAAAGGDIADITVLDATAPLPPAYKFVTDGATTRVAAYPVVLVKDGAANSYYDTVPDAVTYIFMSLSGNYDYIEVVGGDSFVLQLGMLASINIKNTAAATAIPAGIADDCTMTVTPGETYTVYSVSNKPTVYTWTGNASVHRWGNKSNWSFVNDGSETVAASRTPEAGDSVVFTSAVSDLALGADTSVDSVSVGAEVVISREYETDVTLTATSGGIVLTDAGAAITVSGVALSPLPTTTVADSYVKVEATESSTRYSVAGYPVLALGGTAAAWSTGAWKIGSDAVAAPVSGPAKIVVAESTTLTVDAAVDLSELVVTGAVDKVLTLVAGSGSLVAQAVIVEGGVLQQGSASVLGASPSVVVRYGATFDMNGLGINASTKVYLAGAGAGNWPWALTSSGGAGGAILGGLYLSANATIGGANELKVGQTLAGYQCYLQGFTLTKTGAGAFTGTNMNTPGTGTIDVQGGAMSVNQWNNLNNNGGDTTVILNSGTSLANGTDRIVPMGTLKLLGGTLTTTRAFKVKTALMGAGETANLAFGDGASASLTGDLTVTAALTLDGAMAFNKDENAANDVVVTVSGTMSSSGAVSVGAGVTLNLGTNRPTGAITVADGGTLAVQMQNAGDIIELTTSAQPGRIILYDASGNALSNPRVNYSDGTLTIAPAVPTLQASGTVAFDNVGNWVDSMMPSAGDEVILRLSGDATITVSGTYALGVLTITGSGAVKFSGSGSITPGRIDVLAGTTYLCNGAVVSGAIPHGVYGSLKTGGDIALTSTANTIDPAGVLDVESGTLTLTSGDRTLKGTIYVRSGATLAPQTTDAFNYSGTQQMHIYGTLSMGTTRWTTGGNNTIYLYGGASVTGGGNDAGNIDMNASGAGHIVVKRNETTGEAVVNFSAALRSMNNANGTIEVDPGVTLVMSGKLVNQQKITKSGSGSLVFDTPEGSSGGYIWVAEGAVGGRGYVHNITMDNGTKLQPTAGGLSVNGFYVMSAITSIETNTVGDVETVTTNSEQRVTLSFCRIDPASVSAGDNLTLVSVNGNATLSPAMFDISEARYETTVSEKTITATVKAGLPQPFIHYDFNGEATATGALAVDSLHAFTSLVGAWPSKAGGKNGTAGRIDVSHKPYYDSNTSGKSPFYANEMTVATLLKPRETNNTILWNIGSTEYDSMTGIALIAKDASTLTIVSWVNNSAASDVVSVTGVDLLNQWHFVTLVASVNGTALYVDDCFAVTNTCLPSGINARGQFGSIHAGAKGYNPVSGDGYLLDDWCVYDTALTVMEVRKLRNALLPSPFILRLR